MPHAFSNLLKLDTALVKNYDITTVDEYLIRIRWVPWVVHLAVVCQADARREASRIKNRYNHGYILKLLVPLDRTVLLCTMYGNKDIAVGIVYRAWGYTSPLASFPRFESRWHRYRSQSCAGESQRKTRGGYRSPGFAEPGSDTTRRIGRRPPSSASFPKLPRLLSSIKSLFQLPRVWLIPEMSVILWYSEKCGITLMASVATFEKHLEENMGFSRCRWLYAKLSALPSYFIFGDGPRRHPYFLIFYPLVLLLLQKAHCASNSTSNPTWARLH